MEANADADREQDVDADVMDVIGAPGFRLSFVDVMAYLFIRID